MTADLIPSPAAPSEVTTLRAAITALEDQAKALHEAGDLTTLAHGLADLATLRRDLGTLSQSVEAMVADLMPQKKVEVPGLGAIERRRSTDRKTWRWDEINRDVWPLLLAKHDGEIMAAVAEFLEMVSLTGSKAPKLAVFRDRLGLDPDEYAECTPGRTTVQIHRDLNRDEQRTQAVEDVAHDRRLAEQAGEVG
jgi:hypothetical protein